MLPMRPALCTAFIAVIFKASNASKKQTTGNCHKNIAWSPAFLPYIDVFGLTKLQVINLEVKACGKGNHPNAASFVLLVCLLCMCVHVVCMIAYGACHKVAHETRPIVNMINFESTVLHLLQMYSHYTRVFFT